MGAGPAERAGDGAGAGARGPGGGTGGPGSGTGGPGAGVRGRRVPWRDVLLAALACVGWAVVGMAGTAALGLHLLEADSTASLGPMTAAVVALGAGGSVEPAGDVSVFGLKGTEATTALQITPLGVGLVGALLLSWFFLRSLRAAGVVPAPGELLARAGAVVALFVAVLGGLAWAGHDVITMDGGALGLDALPGMGAGGSGTGSGGPGDGGLEIPGWGGLGDLGDLGDLGGSLPDRIGDLVRARAAVGFTVDTGPTLLGGAVWAAGVLLIALLASRRTPLPRGWDVVHRVVRPAVSALVTVSLTAVAAGLAAAAYAAVGDPHPRRIAGAALLGAPNGVWMGVPIGLFVPWDGRATGALARLLPDPVNRLLSTGSDEPVTLRRLAELDGRVWLLGVAAALMMLLAGVLTAVRTPPSTAYTVPSAGMAGTAAVGGGAAGRGPGRGGSVVREQGPFGFAGRCALRLGVVTALALPLLARLTDVSVDASLSVLGFDAFGAGIVLHGHLGTALLLGAAWGAGAGAAGALLAWGFGAAGRGAVPGGAPPGAALSGEGAPPGGAVPPGGTVPLGGAAGPHRPAVSPRAPAPGTGPYARKPDGAGGAWEPEDARPPGFEEPAPGVHGAPTVVGPLPPPSPARSPGPGVPPRPTVPPRPVAPPPPPGRPPEAPPGRPPGRPPGAPPEPPPEPPRGRRTERG